MAEPEPRDVSCTSDFSSGTSASTLQLNVKTLDSRIYNFTVEKNIPVAVFKEKITSQSGVPVGRQRLIFRGKVLKDDHLLSVYNVENGDTLHLVERQPQSASGSSTSEATSSNSNRGQDSNAGGPHNRIGSIAHSIVLGTLNVGDPGEAVVPDISRVIGAVLNSIGISNQTGGMQPGVPMSHVNQAEGSQVNSGRQSQDGYQSVPLQASNGLSASHATQIPVGAAIAAPSMNEPIPDSLNTLMEFMNRMELAFSQNGNQPSQSTTTTGDLHTVELPSLLGLPTVEGLSIVLQHAERLLRDHAVAALSHTAGRLNQEGRSSDPAVRGQVRTESVHLGMAMQHLGALLLELGRTILTLRIGQSSAESFVNAGPAVYISPSGPNPIMVQPFPLQTSSLFNASSGVSPTPIPMGTVGASSIPRNVNIHIHTGAALAPVVPTVGTRVPTGERVNATESGDTGQARDLSGINMTATSVPSQRATVSISGAVPLSTAASLPPESNSTSSMVAEVNAQIRRLLTNMQDADGALSGQAVISTNQEQHAADNAMDEVRSRQNAMAAESSSTSTQVAMMDDQKEQNAGLQPDIKKTVGVNSSSEPSSSSEGFSQKNSHASKLCNDNQDVSSAAPLGLGMGGGLQPKRWNQPRAQSQGGDGASASNLIQQSRAIGQEVLQSLASLSTTGSTNPRPSEHSGDFACEAGQSVPTSQNTDGQSNVADAMSQILDSPALDGLLSGVSQQTGIGSPDMLRNMLQQFTQNPAMRSTVNQIAQQDDSHDLGSMFSGLDRGPGGGIDLGRMMQQMMPIVSQALGGVSPVSQSTPSSEQILSRGMMASNNHSQHINNLHQVVQMLENERPPQEILNLLVDRALDLAGDSVSRESIVNALLGQGRLAREFMEMLRNDMSQRFHDETGS